MVKHGRRGQVGNTTLFLVSLLLMSGCGGSEQLSRSKAADLIRNSPKFNEPKTETVLTGGRFTWGSFRDSNPFEVKLESAGFLTITSFESGAQVSLTPKGQEEAKNWKSIKSGVYLVPVARKELIEVTGISAIPAGADVEFSWKWVPLSLPVSLDIDTHIQKSGATFTLYDDGWRIDNASMRF